MSLKQKTISGIFWSLLRNVGGKGIMFIVMIVLARLLTPEIFGLIGMLMIFIQVSQALVMGGFNQALIQKKNTDEEDYSSVFWINLSMSVLIYGILFFTAPLIANFYDQPVLIELTRALSLVFVINAFSYVQEARLSKEMRFKTLTIVSIPSTVLGGIVAIVMAMIGYGVWSIIALQLVTRFAYAVQIWIYSKWRPLFLFNKEKAKELFSFGSKLMIAGTIQAIFDNIYLIIIGKFFPINTLGYFQNAKRLVDVPTRTISAVFMSVTFSVFSSIQDDEKRLNSGYKKSTEQIIFLLAPLMVLSAILAKPLFSFVLTDKWLPAVPFFQLLCIVGLISPLNANSINVMNAKGRSDIVLKLQIVKKIIIVLSIVIAIPIGIWALVVSQIVNIILAFFLNIFYIDKLTNYSMKQQLKDILPFLLASLTIGLLIVFLDFEFRKLHEWLRIIIGFSVGIGGYILISWKMQFSPFQEISFIIKKKINRAN